LSHEKGPTAYDGRELEAMDFAVNYHRWILSWFRPFLGKRIVEVGAGKGSFSKLILEQPLESLCLVEPSEKMYQVLCAQIASAATAKIITYNALFGEVAREIKSKQQPDSIIYVNVLEHVANDEAELGILCQCLEPGGRIFILVPALQWLYGEFDRQLGHYRRYARRELCDKCERAGFKVLRSGYVDLIGIVPWWTKYRLLKSTSMQPRAVSFYDRLVIPLSRRLESLLTPPIGKNIVLVAERKP